MVRLNFLFLSILLSTLLAPSALHASGSCGSDTYFYYTLHPDFPLDEFGRGRTGIVMPTFARSYLIVAYRQFSGLPLTETERKAFGDYWQLRIFGKFPQNETGNPSVEWMLARKNILGGDQEYIDTNASSPDHEYFLNCYPDAFRQATLRLETLSKRHGANSPETKLWLSAQDAVFVNCGGKWTPLPPLPANADQAIVWEYAYQEASAKFYALKYEEAAADFMKLAEDRYSPHSGIGPYLAARALLREGVFMPMRTEERIAIFDRATAILNGVIQDKARAEWHGSAQRTLKRLAASTHPESYLQTVGNRLAKPSSSDNVLDDLWDAVHLMNDAAGERQWGRRHHHRAVSPAASSPSISGLSDSDLIAWIRVMQAKPNSGAIEALTRWKQHQSTPWLVATLALLPKDHPEAQQAMDAARALTQDSPAYLSANYFRALLLYEQGRLPAARMLLDEMLRAKALAEDVSSKNRLLELRFAVSANMDEIARHLVRIPAGVQECDSDEIPSEDASKTEDIDQAGADLLNTHLTLKQLVALAKNENLSSGIRQRIADMTINRAMLTDRLDILAEFEFEPAESAAADKFLPVATRRFEVTWNYLKGSRVMDPNIHAPDWWKDNEKQLVPHLPQTDDQLAQIDTEHQQLVKAGAAATFLCRETQRWAESHPNDPRSPEALFLAIKATHDAAHDDSSSRYCAAAFGFLHKRFAGTHWAKRAKYWH